MTRLRERVAIVVGAGSVAPGWSNGKACAVGYGRAGASVVCVDYRHDRAQETAALIESEGGWAIALQADATNEDDLQAVVDHARGVFGRIDILHNNVGVGGSHGLPDQITPQAWRREVEQNLTSAFLGIRCVAGVMREAGGGVITNTSSLLSTRFLRSPSVGYSAAKVAVEGLTRACAAGYGRDNIRVNCLRIGISETPLIQLGMDARGLSPERREEEMRKSRAKVPLRNEHTDPFDVAAAAVFLASDEARNITGVILNVDGGLECAPI